MVFLPVLRKGVVSKRPATRTLDHYRTGEPVGEISLADSDVLREDLADQEGPRSILRGYGTRDLIEISQHAATYFLKEALPAGDTFQTPQNYVDQVTATTGLPNTLVRRAMLAIHDVLSDMESVISGLSGGQSFSSLDAENGFAARGNALGVILTDPSPLLHCAWVPATALKMPLILSPDLRDPWTPYRIVQALLRAGAPKSAFSFYAAEDPSQLQRLCSPALRLPEQPEGHTRIVIGEDQIDRWEEHLDLLAQSIVADGGRSRSNARSIWLPRRGREIAEALAARVARIHPLPAGDEAALLAPVLDAAAARHISAEIDAALVGARDRTSAYRSSRIVEFEGGTYLLPTVVQCDAQHALAACEVPFPFASIIEAPESALPKALGRTLVLLAITRNPGFQRRLAESSVARCVRFDAIPTTEISWHEVTERDLFDRLFERQN